MDVNFHNKMPCARFWEFILPAVRQIYFEVYCFMFNSESEILDGPDQSEPSVSGLPDTGVSCESQYDEDDTYSDRELGLDLNQHLKDGFITPSFSCLRQIHSWLRSTMT